MVWRGTGARVLKRSRAFVLMSQLECQRRLSVSADSCSTTASFSYGGTPDLGVFEGVNKKTRLETSVPNNQQKLGSPKPTEEKMNSWRTWE
jgi:hypothetical protein